MADEVFTTSLDEHAVSGRRLGRHIEHDERSRAYPAARAPKVVSVAHARHCAPFDQGQTGSCTGNAEAGLLMTDPLFVTGRCLSESDAVALYEQATHLDRVKGIYPPDDTGSSGLAVDEGGQGARLHHRVPARVRAAARARGARPRPGDHRRVVVRRLRQRPTPTARGDLGRRPRRPRVRGGRHRRRRPHRPRVQQLGRRLGRPRLLPVQLGHLGPAAARARRRHDRDVAA